MPEFRLPTRPASVSDIHTIKSKHPGSFKLYTKITCVDAPCSALSLLHIPHGEPNRDTFYDKNPNIIALKVDKLNHLIFQSRSVPSINSDSTAYRKMSSTGMSVSLRSQSITIFVDCVNSAVASSLLLGRPKRETL